MVRLQTMVNRTLGMHENIQEMRDEKILQMLSVFLKYGKYGINIENSTIETYPQSIDNKKYRKCLKDTPAIYNKIKKRGAIELLRACWEWEDTRNVNNEYYSIEIELMEKYFNHFIAERKEKIKNDEVEQLACTLNNWTDLISSVRTYAAYNREYSKLKYNIGIDEVIDFASKDTLYFLVTEASTKVLHRHTKYSYKWIMLYLNLLNIGVCKPFLEILEVTKKGEVKAIHVPTMTEKQLKSYIKLYNDNHKNLLKGGEIKNELIKVLDDQELEDILRAKEDDQVISANFIIDRYFEEKINNSYSFDIAKYIKEVIPENEGLLGLTPDEWAGIIYKPSCSTINDNNLQMTKRNVCNFFIRFTRVLEDVLYLYGIFGIHYFLGRVKEDKATFSFSVYSSYNEMKEKMNYEMGLFNQQFLRF